ncbi:uncharacterized protein YecE (DUF72 family) [Caldicellulosiruptor bescii]|uniref:DUF72 domain-containing protein n=2 Tax=Caldicellulosiruptor bescii TaxID=31899 RepID=B9MLQ0_CALBD|nr:DUF72 domain-containing protein [Caldicellulosiruptor bescii]ACM59258.1 protein of unknown function DUF72 [Caldicellulosiruptor bescii DSM 6725]PBC88285.1 uncharacterized protein YecE (DUF72 family) [Caldicellulosiruptor bescii]PBC92234.1 uncharacterized protein YecE (DUF72 family) [Caldicellulosiruptor bescii]PBD04957.1 uncharacterized protein YecE (DUF72 family) [Caldicellulosiruptor bescii]PBD05413.1 uncharacterized protein YecE (DUF72 family) [Caldicellulosiruptor bescii]
MNNVKIYIGTSGFSYSHWRGIFYPEKLPTSKMFEFYAMHFRTTEINSSFYRLPQEKTVLNWFNFSQADFVFSLKAPRTITHIKRFLDVEDEWKKFEDRVKLLKEKLGAILLQLPPSFKADEENVKRLLNFLDGKENFRFAIEFRHKSWFVDDIYDILRSKNIAFVIADSSRYPKEKIITANFAYIRFHGPKEMFSSSYSEDQLKNFAMDIKVYSEICEKIYVYFNNDFNGYAVENAKNLVKILENVL